MAGSTSSRSVATTPESAGLAERVLGLSQFESLAQQRRVQSVAIISSGLALIALPTALLVAYLLPDPVANVLLVVAGLALYVVILALLRRRLVSLAAWILVGYFAVAPLLGSVINHDVQASPLFLPLAVVVAACVLPPRQVVVVAIVAFAEIAAMTKIDGPESILVSDMLTYAAVAMLVTSAAAVVLSLAIARALRAADQSRDQAQRLADDLSRSNAELEARVVDRTRELKQALQREQKLSAQLGELTVRDPLTGLHNRRYLDEELPRLLSFTGRHEEPLSVAAIDLDNFKSINDDFSHIMGDEVLQTTARLMSAHTRVSDVLARVGGEEFVLVMPGATEEDALAVCERMREAIQMFSWAELDEALVVTGSFGVTTTRGAASAGTVLRAADALLYRAKREGKNIVRCEVA